MEVLFGVEGATVACGLLDPTVLKPAPCTRMRSSAARRLEVGPEKAFAHPTLTPAEEGREAGCAAGFGAIAEP